MAIALLSLGLFLPTLRFGLVNYDDPWLLAANTKLQQLHLAGIPSLSSDFSTSGRYMLGAEYLPVRDLSIALDFQIWGTWYQGFHVTQVLLYAATVFLLGRLLLGFGLRPRLALGACLLWAVHPVHVESVAWLSERKGVLAAFFVVAAGCMYLRYRNATAPTRRPVALVLSCVLAVCAVWSKAPALFALAGIGVFDLLWLPPSPRRWRGLAALGLVAGVAFIPVFVTAQRSNVIIPDEIVSTSTVAPSKISMTLGLAGHYTQTLFALRPPTMRYAIEDAGPAPVDIAIGAAVLLVLVAVITWSLSGPGGWRRPRGTLILGALLWSAVSYFPFSRLLFPIRIIAADRYMLLPSLGLALVVAAGLARISRPLIFRLALAAVAIASTVLSIRAVPVWRSSVALFANATQQQPQIAELWLRWGANIYTEQRDAAAAEAVIDAGLRVHPADGSLILKKSNFRAAAKDLAGAEHWLRIGAELTHARCYNQLALLLSEAQRHDEAIEFAQRAVDKRPAEPAFRKTLAQVLTQANRLEAALAAWRTLVAMRPDVAEANYELGRALWNAGKAAEAATYLDAAATISPEFAQKVTALRRHSTNEASP